MCVGEVASSNFNDHKKTLIRFKKMALGKGVVPIIKELMFFRVFLHFLICRV